MTTGTGASQAGDTPLLSAPCHRAITGVSLHIGDRVTMGIFCTFTPFTGDGRKSKEVESN